MATYTARFTEEWELLADIHPSSTANEQNTAWFDMANFHRGFVDINAGVLGGDHVINVNQATSNGGAGAKLLKTQTVHNADDSTSSGIEFRTEELDVDGGFHWCCVQILPAASGIMGLQVFGAPCRFAPADSTHWNAITD